MIADLSLFPFNPMNFLLMVFETLVIKHTVNCLFIMKFPFLSLNYFVIISAFSSMNIASLASLRLALVQNLSSHSFSVNLTVAWNFKMHFL